MNAVKSPLPDAGLDPGGRIKVFRGALAGGAAVSSLAIGTRDDGFR